MTGTGGAARATRAYVLEEHTRETDEASLLPLL
jgi:hypothetical protein